MAKFNSYGEKFNYTATGAVAYHDVVVAGSLIGVASAAAKTGETVACDAVGVFAIDKAAEAIEQGAKVYLTSAKKITATASGNTLAGIAWAKAEAADATCLVKINA